MSTSAKNLRWHADKLSATFSNQRLIYQFINFLHRLNICCVNNSILQQGKDDKRISSLFSELTINPFLHGA